MIRVFAKKHSKCIDYLTEQFSFEQMPCDVLISDNSDLNTYLYNLVPSSNVAVLIGDVQELKCTFARIFDLPMYHNDFVAKNVVESFNAEKIQLPPQYLLDAICTMPESFSYCVSKGSHLSVMGEYQKCSVFILPDSIDECTNVFEKYVINILRKSSIVESKCFKIFGLSKNEIESEMSKQNFLNVTWNVTTENLDSRLLVGFNNKCKNASEVVRTINEVFRENIYADSNMSLAETVVKLLGELNKRVSAAESLTGGMVASKIVSVPGASSVLYEGLVTYTVSAKSARLGINPHLIDQYGVVSSEVAHEMVKGLMTNGCDYAISTTGFAGPTSERNIPVGTCFIGIGTPKGIQIFKNVFYGGRNEVREQASNSAMFLLVRSIKN